MPIEPPVPREPRDPAGLSDAELIRIVECGSDREAKDAFAVLEGRYRSLVRGIIRRAPLQAADVDELSNDVFLAAYRAIRAGRFRLPEPFAPWLTTIVRNRILDELRKRRRDRAAQAYDSEMAKLISREPSPETSLETSATNAEVQAAVNRLPARERSVFALKSEDYTFREIGAFLGITPNQAAAAYYRALKMLRDLLRDMAA